jgi:hypothetical protein
MPCNASYARFIFGKFFTSTIILYVLLFAQKVLFFQKVGVTRGHSVSKAPTGHEVISCMEHEFTQLSGRRFHTVKDPNN